MLKHLVKLRRYMLFGDVHSTQHTRCSVTCCHITK